MLEYIVLGVLMDQPLTGYDVKKVIERGVGVFYKASYGSLYPILNRQAEKGHLTVIEQAQGNRQKKLYEITPQGREAFFTWLRSPISAKDSADSHLAKVYFFDQLPPAEAEAQLLAYEENSRAYLAELQGLWAHFDRMEHKECFYYKLSTLCYGIASLQQTMKWSAHIRMKKPLQTLIEEETK